MSGGKGSPWPAALGVGLVMLAAGGAAGWFLQPTLLGDDSESVTTATAEETTTTAADAGGEILTPTETVVVTTLPATTTEAPTTTVPTKRYSDPTHSFTVAFPEGFVPQSGYFFGVPSDGLVQSVVEQDSYAENGAFRGILRASNVRSSGQTVESLIASTTASDAFMPTSCTTVTTEPFTAGAFTGTTVRGAGCPFDSGYLRALAPAPDGTVVVFDVALRTAADEALLASLAESLVWGNDPAAEVPGDRRCFAIPNSPDPALPVLARVVNNSGVAIRPFDIVDGAEVAWYTEPNELSANLSDDRWWTPGAVIRIKVGESVIDYTFTDQPTQCVQIGPPGT